MKLSRRSMLAALGIGTVAGPVAAPAFGKAIAAKGVKHSLGGVLVGSYDGNAAVDVSRYAGNKAHSKLDIMKLIGGGWEERLERARENLSVLERNSHFMFNHPSWSPSYQEYMRRIEFDRRRQELRSLNEKVQDLISNWWKENGEETATSLQESYGAGQSENSGQKASRSR